jgi:hypothetical protein
MGNYPNLPWRGKEALRGYYGANQFIDIATA